MGLFVIGFAPAKFRVRGVANVKKSDQRHNSGETRPTRRCPESLTKYAQVIHRASPCNTPDTALSCIPIETKHYILGFHIIPKHKSSIKLKPCKMLFLLEL